MLSDRRRSLVKRLVLRSLGAFILGNLLLLYVPITTLSLAAILLTAIASLLLDHRNLLTISLSLAAITLVLEVVVRAGAVGGTLSPYFRPHEMLALERTYQPNQLVEMDVPHGDLIAVDPALPRSLSHMRHERFATDSFGYRNEKDYDDEKLIIIGDSFTVGLETYLAMRLRETHQVPTYNASFSSTGPLIYTEKVQWARENLARDACIALFFFEGNDFQLVDPSELAVRNRIPGGLQAVARHYVRGWRGSSEWSKVFFGLTTRARENLRQRTWEDASATREPSRPGVLQETERTFVANVGGKPMAFLRGYAEVVRRRTLDDHGFVRAQVTAGKPDIIVFIPEKYRIYGPLLDEHPETEFPNVQLDYLRSIGAELSIPVIDLTAPLLERSRELLATGELTWWRDDTHWNSNGEAVAAEELLRELPTSGNANCAKAVNR
jgi:hypothetical protein